MTAGVDTVLLAFDGTEPSRRALERAADLAQALDARLIVTSVAELPLPGAIDAPGLGGAARLADEGVAELDVARANLDEAQKLLQARGLEVELVPEVGVPADRIVDLAEDRNADLVVVGRGHPGFLERLLEGSVSEDVSRSTRKDVLIVH